MPMTGRWRVRLSTIPVQVARTLREARRQTAELLSRQVAAIARDNDQSATVANAPRLLDKVRLRGIPAIGGVITDSVIPGSDEHCENLDGV
jgi:hypothetical protein